MLNFLAKYKRVDKSSPWTHGSLCDPKGSYNIPVDKMKEFYKLYSEYKGTKGITEAKTPIYGKLIIDFDFHFEKKITPRPIDTKLINKIVEYFTNVLKLCFEIDDEITDNDSQDSENSDDDIINVMNDKYMCVVLQRPQSYKKKNYYSDGLHIQFPNIICDYDIQHQIRNKFIHECALSTQEGKVLILNLKCVNNLDNIYDKLVIKSTPWLLYGSGKPDLDPYDIISIHNSKLKKKQLSNIQWIKLLSIRENVNNNTKLTVINNELLREFQHDEHTKIIHKTFKQEIDIKNTSTDEKIIRNVNYDINFIDKLLKLLDSKRINEYEYWRNIGMALHYCSLTDKNIKNDYCALWNSWSKKSDKYIEGECKYYWKKFKSVISNAITLRTLYYYVQEDNPEKYTKLKIKEFISMKCKELLPEKDIKISEIINTPLHTFVNLTSKKKCIVSTKNHDDPTGHAHINSAGMIFKCDYQECKHLQLPKDETFFQIPINILKNVFNIQNIYNNFVINIPMKENATMIRKTKYKIFEDKRMNELMFSALDCTGHDIAELSHYLYGKRFKCSSDTQNAVWYEFVDHRWIDCGTTLFRLMCNDLPTYFEKMFEFYENLNPKIEKEISDKKAAIKKIDNAIIYIKNTTNRLIIMADMRSLFYSEDKNFIKNIDDNPYLLGFTNGVYDLKKFEFRDGRPEDYITMSTGYNYISKPSKHMPALMKFLQDIQPNEKNRDYLLKYVSTGLTGVNKKEIITILSGTKRNGKSKFADLIKYTLGDYCVELKNNALTSPEPEPDSPAPSLKKLNKKRMGYASEPSKSGKINNSFYKFITGNDSITVRGLYESKETVFKPTLKLMLLCNKIPSFDDNDDPAVWERTVCIEFPTRFVYEPKLPNEKQRNDNLLEELPLWKQDMMLILIEYYRKFLAEDLKPTAGIKTFTQKYKDSNDIFAKFISEKMEEANTNVSTASLLVAFNEWAEENGMRKTNMSVGEFNDGMRQHFTVEKVKVRDRNAHGVITTTSKLGIKKMKIVEGNKLND